MSLKVRLPLNKSLTKNIGLDNLNITQSNTTIVLNESDITSDFNQFQVAEFNGNNSCIIIPNLGQYFIGGNKPFSICFWMYHNASSAKRGILFGNYNLSGASGGFNLEIKANNSFRFWWLGSPDWETGVTLELKTWIHICIVYDGTKIKVYKNGILGATRNGTLSTASFTSNFQIGKDSRDGSSSTPFLGYISDFRIYDNALSSKEIYEISKGLMLHWKLDDQYLSDIHPNLYDQCVMSQLTVGVAISKVNDRYQIRTQPISAYPSGNSARFYVPLNILQGKESSQFYIQFKYKVISGGADFTSFDWCDAYPVTIAKKVISDDYTYVVIKLPVLSTAAPSKKYNSTYRFLDINSLDGSSVIQMWDIKFEEGTNWTLYSKIGEVFSSDILDYSGFERNASYIQGALITTNDAKKYNYSLTLSGSTTGIQSEEFQILPNMTYMAWIKIPSTGSKFLFDNRKTVDGYSSGRGVQPAYIAGMGTIQIYSSTGGSNNHAISPVLPTNTWFHIAITLNPNGNAIYVNGEKIIQGTTAKGFLYIAAFTLGMRFTYTSPLKGQVNDVRVYRTELTQDQIKQMYQQAISMDNKNNLYAYEYIEDSSIQIIKNGILDSSKFIEDDTNIKFYKNKNIQANNIIEI